MADARYLLEKFDANRREYLKAMEPAEYAEELASIKSDVAEAQIALEVAQQWVKTGSDQILKQAKADGKRAVAAKKQFLSLYNQLRAEVGLSPLPSTYYF